MDRLFQMVKDTIMSHSSEQQEGRYDTNGLLNKVQGLFSQHPGSGNVRPASEDPYGDPAEQPTFGAEQGRYGAVRPASEDPYGDPADQEVRSGSLQQRYPGIRPASQDPYGDPADQA